MPDPQVIVFDELPRVDRGTGIVTQLIIHRHLGSENLTTGVTTFQPGTEISRHWHNCDESVTIIEGEAVGEIAGERHVMRPYDTTFVPAGVPHRFLNTSDQPMRILFIYAAGYVTRTFADTGVTVEHMSTTDRAVPPPSG